MPKAAYIVQLPFPRLDYFPCPQYFNALQSWYRHVVSPSCHIPEYGLWEAPPWITWIKAALTLARSHATKPFDVHVVDLSDMPFSVQAVIEHLPPRRAGDLYCFSPLTQNSELTVAVVQHLQHECATVALGGKVYADHVLLPNTPYFPTRIEHDYFAFCTWLSSIWDVDFHDLPFDPIESFSCHLDWSWAQPRYDGRVFHFRAFSHHGCPLTCAFCADRASGKFSVDSRLLEAELVSLANTFPTHDVLYIGDLTFGFDKRSIGLLQHTLLKAFERHGRTLRLIVQTNPALITESFADQLCTLGVALVELGVESGSSMAVRRVSKHRPSDEWLRDKFDILQSRGIRIAANLVVGLPSDGIDDYARTVAFVENWRSKVWFHVYGFVPYPSTPIFRELQRDNRIFHYHMDKWCEGREFVFAPYRISADDAYRWFVTIVECAAKTAAL